MKRVYIKAFNALKKLGVPVYEHGDDQGNFSISGEDNNSYMWVDYYAEGGSIGIWKGEKINPKLYKLLDNHNLYAEWVNAGRLSVYQK